MRRLLLSALALSAALGIAACGSGAKTPSGDTGGTTKEAPAAASPGADKQQTVNLTMWLFTGTGLEDFVKQYEKDHPNIRVKIQQQEYGDHHNSLVTALAAGSGAPDIALVEIGYIDRFKADPSKFYNLAELGADKIMDRYLEWKRVQASSADGKFIFGIPTDIGPMAMMYRLDIFEQAGLPTNRDEVTRLIDSWEKFIEVGKTIKAKTGKPMIDAANSAYDVIKGQLTEHYFDKNGNLIVETNPGIRRAYDLAVKMAQEGLTAKIAQWSPEWSAGMNKGDFAVQLAPAWMMSFMQTNAPDSKGKWDVALMPEGSGNWGGSFLTIPKESKHPKEAFELISWLLAPEQQLALFKKNGNFPSTPSVYDDPAIKDFKNPFFNNAPVGQIYSEAAKKVVPVYYGPDYITVDTPIKNAITAVERNNRNPDEEWKKAIEEIKRALKK
ncbi:MAG: hypothetical protein BLM47_06095 [Candidatus Reconcilbacillus cellulovorans]|uniref:Sugar transporter n=1 Tax=Candidatus Reconcilbacillus cellulovorans TaxID=1906605 RepID=A0A2A6E0V1_9BACL|nr:MAG: hypothetical protein BLM47_06095 [Candidatus Reconcilbacillus cellulovorans]